MTLPTMHGPWIPWALWNGLAFLVALVVNSFIEWAAHRFILHSPKIVRFAYELHDRQHHVIMDGGENYHAKDEFARKHVAFVPRDYALFLLFTTPLWIAAELACRRPMIAGGILATLVGLQAFNSLHWRFHVPSDSRFQRSRFFRYLKGHHKLHHADTKSNFNVYFLPLADWVLGTLKKI
jgi:hypothetical protein